MQIIFDFNRLENQVISSIDDALVQLNEAIGLANNLNSPANVSHANFLRTLNSDLRGHARSLNSLVNNFNTTHNRLRNASNNNNSQFSRINEMNIPRRSGAINSI